jgi:hypothetical protein
LAVKCLAFSHYTVFQNLYLPTWANCYDCYLASYCTHVKALKYYRYISIFWLHDSSQHHTFPEVGELQYRWQITTNAASNNQSAMHAVPNILLPHM